MKNVRYSSRQKPIDEEIFEAALVPDGERERPDIAESNLDRLEQAELAQRIDAQRDRIGEELPQEINPREATADQHHFIRMGGRGGIGIRHGPLLVLIIDLDAAFGAGLDGKNVEPPFHDPVGFGEEPMPADIDPIPLIIHRSRDPAHIGASL